MALHPAQPDLLPCGPAPTLGWEHLQVDRFQPAAGEGTCHCEREHALFISLAPRPVPMVHRQAGKTYTGLYGKGDMAITPADTPLFARWEGHDDFLQIRLTAEFLRQVAQETLDRDGDRTELLPQFRHRNPELETIGLMLFTELQRGGASNQLYLDSLANVLAVNLLRHYGAIHIQVPTYEGGLPSYQLRQVLDYIDAHLGSDISLADLAQLVDMSPFHFSRLFKQSVGRSPHHYLLQQRVEQAKQLLKHTDRLILDIALDCGFSSHSHLSKLFRKFTGTTPKAYRAS
nr:AraC family transcriptional regulator [Nodosilinea nodulosa]